jgi:hypothetical protein
MCSKAILSGVDRCKIRGRLWIQISQGPCSSKITEHFNQEEGNKRYQGKIRVLGFMTMAKGGFQITLFVLRCNRVICVIVSHNKILVV